MTNIKEKMQKIGKFIVSRMFYFILGVCIAVAIPIAYAAWNSTVSSGQTLTTALWNDVVAKLVELNTKTTNLENKVPAHLDCVVVNAATRAVCPVGKFLVEMDRFACPGPVCTAKCCKPW